MNYTSHQKNSGLMGAHSADYKKWDKAFREIYDDYQLYLMSGGRKGAKITSAHEIKFPQDLSDTCFEDADLTGADLTGRYLTNANLKNTTLTGANLKKTHMWEADLTNADLTGANLEDTVFASADLRGTTLEYKGLIQTENWGGAAFPNIHLIYDDTLLKLDEGRMLIKSYFKDIDVTTARYLAGVRPATKENDQPNNRFPNTQLLLDSGLLKPDQTQKLIKARTGELETQNAQDSEDIKSAKQKISAYNKIFLFTGSIIVASSLHSIFTDNADPNPLEEMSGTDQEIVCASAAARKILSIDDDCGRLGLILPTPDNGA